MLIAKRDIVEVPLARRDHQRAILADEELPALVDADLHSGLLERLGLDPALLARDVGMTSGRFDRRHAPGRHTLAGAGR
jgi:hypothetical protein